jgi:CRISPR/Cas system-associated protein endoribonuclease Cas2
MISLLPKLAKNYAYTRETYQKLYDINTEKGCLNCATVNSHNFAKIVILRLNYKQY